MTTVDRSRVTQRLRQAGRSELASHIESAGPERLSSSALSSLVDSFQASGRRLSSQEELALRRVHTLLKAAPLFDVAESSLSELRKVSQVEAPARPKQAELKPFPFSSPVAARIAPVGAEKVLHETWSVSGSDKVYSVPALSRDAASVYVLDIGAKLKAYERTSGELQWQLSLGSVAHGAPVLSPDGKTLYAATGQGETTVYAVDLDSQSIRWSQRVVSNGSGVQKTTLAVSPDGRFLYVPSIGGKLVKLDSDDGAEVWCKSAGPTIGSKYSAISTSPDGSKVFVRDGGVSAYDTEDGELLWSAPVDRETEGSAMPSPDGQTLVVPGFNKLYAFDAESGAEKWVKTLYVGNNNMSPTFSRDGSKVYMPASDGWLHRVDVETGVEEKLVRNRSGSQWRGAFALNADETKAFGADGSNVISVLDLEAKQCRTLGKSYTTYGGFVLSPDAQYAYLGSNASVIVEAVFLG